MKRFLFPLLAGIACYGSDLIDPASPRGAGPEGAVLIFSDEFNGPELDRSKWNLGINRKNIQNTSVQCVYRMENISFRDGKLIFTQKREIPPVEGKTYGGVKKYDYSSGGLNTQGKFSLENNMYIELRVKLPDNNGGYGAFWTMSEKTGNGKPEDLLEIDMFEFIGNRKKTRFWSGLWWHDFRKDEVPPQVDPKNVIKRSEDHYFINNQLFKAHFGYKIGEVPADKFNFYDFITFGLKVTDNTIEWYLRQNGPAWESKPYLVFRGGTVHNRTYGKAPDITWQRFVPKDMHARIILNYALRTAVWAGGPPDDRQLPAEMVIDYLRVYRLP